MRASEKETEAMKKPERELTKVEHDVLSCVVLGNASLDLFRRNSRADIDAAIRVLRNLEMIRMGARGYYLATAKGRRRRWANKVAEFA
jgi:hypothetical protein